MEQDTWPQQLEGSRITIVRQDFRRHGPSGLIGSRMWLYSSSSMRTTKKRTKKKKNKEMKKRRMRKKTRTRGNQNDRKKKRMQAQEEQNYLECAHSNNKQS